MQPSDVRVVYKDEHWLVLDKPVGIATTAPEGGACLFELARALDPAAPQLHPLSRLDTQVSGIVTFARTDRCNRFALRARQQGALWRRYLGITAAPLDPPEGDFHWSIGLDPRDPKKRRALDASARGGGVKAAHTHYAVRAHAGPLWAVDLFPRTGRTHQLRVHMSRAGAPLAGDISYGGPRRITLDNGRVLTAGRVMLHCAAFHAPMLDKRDEVLALELAPPEDMQTYWRSAGGDPSALVT